MLIGGLRCGDEESHDIWVTSFFFNPLIGELRCGDEDSRDIRVTSFFFNPLIGEGSSHHKAAERGQDRDGEMQACDADWLQEVTPSCPVTRRTRFLDWRHLVARQFLRGDMTASHVQIQAGSLSPLQWRENSF